MHKVIFYVFVLFLLVGVHATGSKGGCQDEAGNVYADGDSLFAADDCNRCFCSDEKISCTNIICLDQQGWPTDCTKKMCLDPQVCVHNGIEYKVGELYKNNCNRCLCLETGVGLCSMMRCPPKVCKIEDGKMYAAGEQFMATDGCNRCTCGEKGFTRCTLVACHTPISE